MVPVPSLLVVCSSTSLSFVVFFLNADTADFNFPSLFQLNLLVQCSISPLYTLPSFKKNLKSYFIASSYTFLHFPLPLLPRLSPLFIFFVNIFLKERSSSLNYCFENLLESAGKKVNEQNVDIN